MKQLRFDAADGVYYQPPKTLILGVIASEAKQPSLVRFVGAVYAHVGVRGKGWVASLMGWTVLRFGIFVP